MRDSSYVTKSPCGPDRVKALRANVGCSDLSQKEILPMTLSSGSRGASVSKQANRITPAAFAHPCESATTSFTHRNARPQDMWRCVIRLCPPACPRPLICTKKRIAKVFGTPNLIAASTRRVKPSEWQFAFAHDFCSGGRGQGMTTAAAALLPKSPGRCGPLRCESAPRSASLFRDSSLNAPRDTGNGFMLHTLAAAHRINSG